MTVEESVLRVLHVLPTDLARGAQVYARALADCANATPGEDHQVVVLFASPRVAALAEHELGVPSGRLHTVGLDPRAALRLWRLVRHTRPDVVVAHGAESMKYALFVRGGGRRVVCHAIGVVSPKARQGASFALHRTLVRRADLITAVSTAVADELHDVFGVDRVSIRVIPNGRDPAVFSDAAPTVRSRPQLLFVGHVTRTKRPEVFVRLVAELRRRGCTLDAAVVGAGPMEAELEGAAAAAAVEMLGRRADVPQLLQAASIFVFPSMAEGEGMPGVIIEAGLAGLPVVGTDVPGVGDVVVDGETGRIVAEDDVEGLIAAAEQLLRDGELRAEMGAAARERCTRLFSLDASVQLFRQALGDVVAAPAG